ncbi:MAG: hypothetical protein ACI9KE_004173 [Polyangiales bacterium]|jgi:hypothetical protein
MSIYGRALLLALLGACSFAGPAAQAVNLCSADDECGAGRCEAARCVSTTVESMQVVFRVVPTDTTDLRPLWTSESHQITAPQELNLGVPGWVEVRGQVRFGDERVAAELEFSRAGLPGLPGVVVRTRTLEEALIDDEGNETDYIARLEAGQAYDVLIRPSVVTEGAEPWERRLPPLRVLNQLVTPEPIAGVPSAIWRAMFPYGEELRDVCGATRTERCTLQGSVVSMIDMLPQAEEGLLVQAIDEEGNIVSSTSVTDEEGIFSLVIGATGGAYVLRVSAAGARPLFPTIEADPSLLSEDLRIRVPAVRSIEYQGIVEDASGNAANATLEFVSNDVADEESGLRGSFRANVIATEGRFNTILLPGNYDVTITPTDLSFAVGTESIQIAPSMEGIRGQLFRVDRRTQLGGSVIATNTILALSDVPVEARAVADATRNRTSESVTDETGRFALLLDVGNYDLFLRPSVESGFAWIVAPDLAVGAVDSTLISNYQATPPVPVHGIVRDANNNELAGLEVRAFALSGERYVEVGRSRIGDDGSYEVLLPAAFATP